MESTPVSKEDVKNQLSDVPSLTPVGATGMRRDHESIDDFEHLEPEPSPVKETAGKNSPELLDKLVSVEQESVSGSGRESLISGAKAPESQNSSDFSLLSDSKLDSPLAENTPDMIEEMTAPSGSPGKITDFTNALKTNDNDLLPDYSMQEKKAPVVQQPEELSSTMKQETEKLFSKAQDLFSVQQFDTDPKAVAQSFMTTERVEMMAEGDVPKFDKSGKFSDDLEFLKYESQHEPNLATAKMLKDPTDLNMPTELGPSLPAHVRDDLHDDDSFKDTDSLPELVKSNDRQLDILPEDPKVYKSPKEDEFEDGIEDDYDIPGLSSHIQLSDKLDQYQTKPMSVNEPKKSDDLPSAESNVQHPDKEPLFTEIAKPGITPEPISKALSEPSIKPTPLVPEPSAKTHSVPKTVPPAEKHVPEDIGEPSFFGALAFGKTLQRRWKSLRDSFSREMNTQKLEGKSGSAKSNRRKHVYFKQLSFLRTNMAQKNTASNLDEIEISETSEEKDTDKNEELQNEIQDSPGQIPKKQHTAEAIYRVRSRKRGMSQVETAEIKLMNEMAKRLSQPSYHGPLQKEETDEDRLFLLCLLKDLKRIPEENKLDAKSELMMVLKKWQKSSQSVYTAPANASKQNETTASQLHHQRQTEPQETRHHSHIHTTPTPAVSLSSPAASDCSQDTSFSYLSDYYF